MQAGVGACSSLARGELGQAPHARRSDAAAQRAAGSMSLTRAVGPGRIAPPIARLRCTALGWAELGWAGSGWVDACAGRGRQPQPQRIHVGFHPHPFAAERHDAWQTHSGAGVKLWPHLEPPSLLSGPSLCSSGSSEGAPERSPVSAPCCASQPWHYNRLCFR